MFSMTALVLLLSLHSTVLKKDFRQELVNTIKSVHSTAILHCRAPRGERELEVTWKHNGVPVETNDRIKIQEDGDLVISLVETRDVGEYVCVAKNMAGVWQSLPAQLTVLEKPVITKFPEQITAEEGQTVEFQCDFIGDSTTKLRWEKNGERNSQKWREKDQTLRITNIDANDTGAYTCIAENDAGSAWAVGHLTVEYTPRFLVRPHHQTVAAGRSVTLQCAAIGNPMPIIFWKTKSQHGLLFQNEDKGRFGVGIDGTLRIERVEKKDEGTYSCHSKNTKGEAQVEAVITVRASFSYLKNVTWREANEKCDLATPPITDLYSLTLELPNIPDEYRGTDLWTGYYIPDILIENIGCMSAVNHTPTISVTGRPLTGYIACCFSICEAAATIGIQRKGNIFNCYCLTDDESPHERSVNHCTDVYGDRFNPYYGGKESQIALYRKAETRSVSDDEGSYYGCIAYDIMGKEYVYKRCWKKAGVFCQNNDGDPELRHAFNWDEGAKHCINISSVLPNEITPGLLAFLPNDSQVTHIWTRLIGNNWIIWEKPAITPVKGFWRMGPILNESIYYLWSTMDTDGRYNAICNDPLPDATMSNSSIPTSPTPTAGTNYSAPFIQTSKGQTNLYMYIGITVGVVFLVVAAVVIVLLVRRKVNRTSKKDRIASESVRKTNPDCTTEDTGNGAMTDDVEQDHFTGNIALGEFYHTTEFHHRINDENTGVDEASIVYEGINVMSDSCD